MTCARASIIAAVLALAALAACGKSKSECKAESDDLMTFLRAMDRSVVLDLGDAKLATRTGLPRTDLSYAAPLVIVTPKGLVLHDAPVAPDQLATVLTAARTQLEADIAAGHFSHAHPPDPAQVYFAIDADVPWSQVVSLTDSASTAGLTHVGFVVGHPSPVPPPPRTPTDDEIDTFIHDRPHAATKLAEIASRIVEPCGAMKKVFGAVSSDEGGDKGAEIIEGTGPALIECKCSLDVPALRTVLWRVAGNPHPIEALSVELVRDAPPLAQPGATPWAAAQAQLVPGAQVWLAQAP